MTISYNHVHCGSSDDESELDTPKIHLMKINFMIWIFQINKKISTPWLPEIIYDNKYIVMTS